mgnify:CR=1 FL=1
MHSFHIPVSAAMFPRRDSMPPLPPAPALLIFDSRVSAGCEMIAAATPAMTPEASDTDRFSELDISFGFFPSES